MYIPFDSGESLGRKLCVFNARNKDGVSRTPVVALVSSKEKGKILFALTKQEIEVFVAAMNSEKQEMQAAFRYFRKLA